MLVDFDPPVIAHRGASYYAPENTLSAFVKAAQLGIRWVEFDVMQTSCGELVVFHDKSLRRTTNGFGRIHQRPYAYLQTLDAGAWFGPLFAGERIPTLVQVVEFLQRAKMCANVEIKPLVGNEMKFIQCLFAKLAPFSQMIDKHLLFSSFSFDVLSALREFSDDCMIGMLLSRWRGGWQELCEALNCMSVHVAEEIMTPYAAEHIKAMDKKLLCYTVNEIQRAQELYGWGVDALFSDAPDRLLTRKANLR